VFGDLLACVNSRQEGKLTHSAGNRNGKAKGMFRLRVFVAILTNTYFCPAGISLGDEIYFTLDIDRPLRLSGCSETAGFVVSEPNRGLRPLPH
jgi:hypothetical protein